MKEVESNLSYVTIVNSKNLQLDHFFVALARPVRKTSPFSELVNEVKEEYRPSLPDTEWISCTSPGCSNAQGSLMVSALIYKGWVSWNNMVEVPSKLTKGAHTQTLTPVSSSN